MLVYILNERKKKKKKNDRYYKYDVTEREK